MYCVTRGAAAGHNGGGMWAVGAVTCHSNTGLDTASNIGSTRLLGIISWLAHTFPWTFLAFYTTFFDIYSLQVFIVPFLDIKRFFATCCIISLLLLTSQELEDLSFPQLNSITNIGEQLRNILEQKHTITQGALQFSHLIEVMWEVIIITLV